MGFTKSYDTPIYSFIKKGFFSIYREVIRVVNWPELETLPITLQKSSGEEHHLNALFSHHANEVSARYGVYPAPTLDVYDSTKMLSQDFFTNQGGKIKAYLGRNPVQAENAFKIRSLAQKSYSK